MASHFLPREESFSEHRPALPASPFRTKLIEEVQRKLRKAVESTSQRREVLQQLFTDIALEIDNRARGLLYGQMKLPPPAEEGGGKSSQCFYEILAEHYKQRPEDGESLMPLFAPLWSQPFTSQIFALLLHQWLFTEPVAHAEEISRFSRAFITGTQQLCWIDLQSNIRRFRSLYSFMLDEVALDPGSLAKMPLSAHRDLGLLVSRFFFLYEPPEKLSFLLLNLPSSMGNSFIGGPADVFATELTNQLQKIKVEPVLLNYIRSSHGLMGLELRTTTSIRLQVALYSMASPGGPLFPTRAVRHAAWAALDALFPVGRRFRHLISLGFRLLHPYYWPGSFCNFLGTVLESISDCLHRIFPGQRQPVRKARQSPPREVSPRRRRR